MISEAAWETIRVWLVTTGLRILIVIVLTWSAMWILRIGIKRFRALYQDRHPGAEIAKRVDTLSAILRRVGLVLILGVAGMVLLSQLGVKLAPVIAAAGIGGLAIGFGAQSLVRDVISGFFILVEDQVRVGDVVMVNGQGGLVEAVTLRYIRLRDISGVVHFFPNGTIEKVANMTKEFSYYVVDMGVAYREDTDEVVEVMRRTLEEMRGEEPWSREILEPLDVFGVDRFEDFSVVVRVRIKTRPLQQWRAGREFNRRIKKAFDSVGIEIPFPHRTVYWGESKDGTPATLHLSRLGRTAGGREASS
jgi:small conductance mechanosensitive channel